MFFFFFLLFHIFKSKKATSPTGVKRANFVAIAWSCLDWNKKVERKLEQVTKKSAFVALIRKKKDKLPKKKMVFSVELPKNV